MRELDVLELHSQFLGEFGFDFHPSHLMFFKDFPHGKQVIFIHYSEYPEVSYLEYNLGVRIDRVEEIIHRFLPTLSDYAERSITLIQKANKIGNQIPSRFELHTNSELGDALMASESFFVTHGFHWLDEMINPKKLEQAFAARKDRVFQTQNFVYFAFRGVTLAKLYKPEDYPELRKIYLKEIKEQGMTPFTIASFLQLLNYLDHLSV
ncbi:MAG: hypothetical protein HWE15_07910 [Algoriphagus sp.]|uniref:hypothetical protein n=1 Tax=Algoriphagus sp. TaxID=1872435 RepID=UPI00180A5C1C|nr:hypothetical protein [Algoriphagus sp.]NVJ86216.1 hypothetical protein [Algoriphagus sp.]